VSEQPKLRAFYEADSLHTEIYDALGASLITGSSVEGDTAFYRRLSRETGGPILEVGCGTGRVATALAADGHEVVGIDLSAPMLRLAEQRREALSADAAARLSFHLADMTTLDLGRDFALIVAPSRVFQFMLTSAAQREALAALRTHLRPNGRLVLDLFDPLLDRVVPSAEVTTRGGALIHPTTGNRVTWEITGQRPDPARQLIVEDWTFSEIDASGEVLRTTTEQLACAGPCGASCGSSSSWSASRWLPTTATSGAGHPPTAASRSGFWATRRADSRQLPGAAGCTHVDTLFGYCSNPPGFAISASRTFRRRVLR
jgi:SAM-dependent methyltransferase